MTSSNISTMGGMAGGGLVVSSSGNKQLNSANSMFAPGHPQHPGNHNVPQGLPNGPMISRVNMPMNQRGAGSLHMGPRLQGPALCGPQGMAGNTPYSYPNPNVRPQGVQVGK